MLAYSISSWSTFNYYEEHLPEFCCLIKEYTQNMFILAIRLTLTLSSITLLMGHRN